MGNALTIGPASAQDAEAIARIYNQYVTDSAVTFEESPIDNAEVEARWREVTGAGLPFLVAAGGDGVAGFAYASRWKGRCAYRYSVEVSVYLDPAHVGRGVGSQLYGVLFPILVGAGLHAVIAGIALPNAASVALHEKFGLRKVAHFSEVGFKLGRWVDVGYWQRVFAPPAA